MSSKGASILVLRSGALGDFVLTLPALEALRRWRPGAPIELIAHPRMGELALAAGLVQRVHSVDAADMARLFVPAAELPAGQKAFLASFDRVVSYLHDPSGVVAANLRAAGCRRVVVGSPLVAGEHAVLHLLRPLAEWGIPMPARPVPRLELPPEHRARGRARLGPGDGRVVVLHPGSGSPRKNWPLTRFVELAVALRGEAGVEPVFTAGEADEEAAQALKRQTSFKVLEGCSVLELAGALSACDGYLGNDSGVTHLAAAAGAPVVALFGPTDPGLWGPQGENVRIVRALPAAGGPEAIPAAQVLAELLTCTNRGRAGVSPAENRSECATRAFPAASALPRIGGRSR